MFIHKSRANMSTIHVYEGALPPEIGTGDPVPHVHGMVDYGQSFHEAGERIGKPYPARTDYAVKMDLNANSKARLLQAIREVIDQINQIDDE